MYQFRNFAVWIVIALLLFALFSLFQGQVGGTTNQEISYSQFFDRVNSGEIKSVTYSGESISGKLSDGKSVQAYGIFTEEDLKSMRQKGVEVSFRPQQTDSLAQQCADLLAAHAAAGRRLGVFHPANAIRLRQGHGLWQIQGEAADRKAGPRDL